MSESVFSAVWSVRSCKDTRVHRYRTEFIDNFYLLCNLLTSDCQCPVSIRPANTWQNKITNNCCDKMTNNPFAETLKLVAEAFYL